MPNRLFHRDFDLVLELEGMIHSSEGGDTVHSRLDKGVKEYGAWHREEDSWHTEAGIRDRINAFAHLAKPRTRTDYLRMGLGHLVLDEVCSKNPGLSDARLIEMALRLFKRRGYHRKYYKERLY